MDQINSNYNSFYSIESNNSQNNNSFSSGNDSHNSDYNSNSSSSDVKFKTKCVFNFSFNEDYQPNNDEFLISINEKNSEIILALIKCFICLSPSYKPLSCPKCNNFACEKCFKKFFKNHAIRKCPLCKQNIKYEELKYNKIVNDIEHILIKDESSTKKIFDLSYLMNNNKILIYKNQEKHLKELINKIIECQKAIKKYRKQYEEFFARIKLTLDKTFDEYENKIKEIFNKLFQTTQDSEQFNEINQNKNYNQEIIKSIISEILSNEREKFNHNKIHYKDKNQNNIELKLNKKNKKEVENFLTNPLFISFKVYDFSGYINIEKKQLNQSILSKKCKNEHLGTFVVQYIFEKDNKYSSLCNLKFNRENDYSNYFLIQRKIVDNKYMEVIPMKLEIDNGEEYLYENVIDFYEFKKKEIKVITMEIKVQIFSVITKY